LQKKCICVVDGGCLQVSAGPGARDPDDVMM